MSTDRLAVAQVLEQIADFLEFKEENPFRVRAFRTAAKAIMELPGSLAEALADGSLAAVRGIGPATLAITKEFLDTGRSRMLEELRREIPPGVLELLSVPGLGITRVRTLHRTLGIGSLDDLERAARDGRLAKVPGFGAKTADKVLRGIGFVRGKRELRLAHEAAREAELLRATLAGVGGVRRAVIAGEIRRRTPIVGELALVLELVGNKPEAVLDAIRGSPGLRMEQPAAEPLVLQTPKGLPLKVWLTTAATFGAILVQATGSASHLALLAERAAMLGLELTDRALLRREEPVPAPEETDLYRALGLADIPAELREGLDEVERAAAGPLSWLVERTDLRGLVHCHSTWSDGTVGIAELAQAAGAAGYEYLGLSDHSQAAAYAGGLRLEDLERQWEEIAQVNASGQGARVLRGIEADILGDGRLDYDDETLARFDFVIGSIHSRLGLGQAEMTNRVLRALDHPALTMLGHPTGRLLLAREPFALDFDAISARAAERGVALEINGDPHRLDLDWRLVRRARELGVTIVIGSDAHGLADFENVEYACWMARKAGLTAAEVLNSKSADAFLAFARSKRG
ncbi:MAG: helix-hairpin-helix domain-containing protein [Gemmatimonadales bacterium]